MLGGEPRCPSPVHRDSQLEAHTRALQPGPPPSKQRLVELEGRDPGGEQAADLAVAVIEGHSPARGVEPLGAGEPRRTGADHCRAAPDTARRCTGRGPTGRQGAIQDGPLHSADDHGALHSTAGAAPLAQAVLGAEPAADLRQGVGRLGDLRGLGPAPRGRRGQPVGDAVAQRAGVAAAGDAAIEAAGGLPRQEGQTRARRGYRANRPAARRRAGPGWARGRRSPPGAPPAAGWHRAARRAERGCAHRGWPGHRWGTRRRSGRSPCSPPGP